MESSLDPEMSGRAGEMIATPLHEAGVPLVLVGRDHERLRVAATRLRDAPRLGAGQLRSSVPRLGNEAPGVLIYTVGPFTRGDRRRPGSYPGHALCPIRDGLMTSELKPAPRVLGTLRSALRSAPSGLAGAVRTLCAWHGPLTWFAGLMVVWGVVSLVGYFADPRLLAGDHIWAKPLKFNISLALYSVTLAWLVSVIRNPILRRIAWWAGTLGAVSSLLEIGVITLQVVRGTSSHFNISTPFDKAMYLLMATGVVFLYGATLVIGVLLQFSSTVRDRSLVWALRLGLLVGFAGLSVGFLMLIPTAAQLVEGNPKHVGSHSVGGDDPTGGLYFLGWNTEHGDLRIPHFIGMHALQLLPLLALALAYFLGGRLHEGTRLRIVVYAAVAYAAVTAGTLSQALRGQSIVHPDGQTLAVAGVAVLLGAAGAAIVVVRYVRPDLAGVSAAALKLGVPPTGLIIMQEPLRLTASDIGSLPSSSRRNHAVVLQGPARARRARILAVVYFVLALAGLVGTWTFNLHFRGGNFVAAWFANAASSSIAVDAIVIGLVASVFYFAEHRMLRRGRLWAVVFVVVSFVVAVSFALPLFLGLRELSKARAALAPSERTKPRPA